MADKITEYANSNTLIENDIYDINKGELECPVCLGLVINPYHCKNCQSPLCGVCSSQIHKCPICGEMDSYIKSVMLNKLVSKLSFKCTKCEEEVVFDDLIAHYTEKCKMLVKEEEEDELPNMNIINDNNYETKYQEAMEKVEMLERKNSKLDSDFKDLFKKVYAIEREKDEKIENLKKQNEELTKSSRELLQKSNEKISYYSLLLEKSNSFKSKLHPHTLKNISTTYVAYCDICKRYLANKMKIYRCESCKFDLCPTCKDLEDIEGKIVVTSPFHPGCLLKAIPVGYATNYCNVCLKKVSHNYFFRCEKCDYDLCTGCQINHPINRSLARSNYI